jgi:hypothetical protein
MAKKLIRLPTIVPRWYQMLFKKVFDSKLKQYLVIAWPRRAGKDMISFACMVDRAIEVPGSYYYLFPTRAWAQRALWDNICEWAGGVKMIDLLCPPEIVKRKNNSDFFIDLINGSRIKIDGTDNLNFVGQGGSGYVLSEFSLHKPEVTGFLAPILTEGNAWVIFNGTLRGKSNHLWGIYDKNKDRDGWYTQWYTLEHTKTNYWLSPDGEINVNSELIGQIDPESGKPYKNIQEDIDAGLISYTMARQEYLNEATSIVERSYYGHELQILVGEGRYGDIDMENQPVYTFWDLGTSDETAIIFAQVIDEKFVIIDYHESSGKKIEDYAIILASRGYSYGGHYAPHDVSKKMLFGDLITRAKEVGVDFRRVPKTNSVLEDIEICRRRTKDVWIDGKCEEVLTHLENYREGNARKPVHDEHSHCADAYRTMIMAKHLNLITHYLKGGKKIHLPDSVSDKADDYAETGWDGQKSDGVFWNGMG